jgi:hypothetical protein
MPPPTRIWSALGTEDREVTGDRRPTPESDDNVVRFPREWLGPTEELVPFGSPADETPLVADASAPDMAADFWGEDSAALQAVVEGPAGVGSSDTDGAAPRGILATRIRVSRRRGLAGAAAVVAVFLAVAGSVLGSGGKPSRPAHKTALSIASVSGVGDSAAEARKTKAVRRPAARHSVARRSARARNHRSPARHLPTRISAPATGSGSAASTANTAAATSSPPPTGPSSETRPAQNQPPTQAASAAKPAQPSPTGALTCISNCG